MRRIKDKMMLAILPSMAVLLIGLTIIIACYIYFTDQDHLLNRNLLTARNYANQIDSFLAKFNAIARTMSHSQMNYEGHSRAEVFNFIKQIAQEDKTILGTWVIYEPNAFDNQDARYINKTGHDKTGRFLPYCNRLKGGELVFEPNIDVETSDYYITPRKTKEPYIPTPYLYDGVLLMSFIYPILKENVFRGVAAIDISIDTVEKLLKGFEEKKLYKSNYAILVSDTGIFISSSIPLFNEHILNKKTISQVASETGLPEYETLAKEILLRKEGYIDTKDPFTKEDVVAFYSPIKTGNLSIIVSISKSDLLAKTVKGIYILTFIGIACLVIIGALLYFLINTIIDPLNKFTDTVVQFGKQDFTKRSKVSTNDEIGELSKNFNSMADAIEEYSNEMEQKVITRTLELNNSLDKITKMKYQQDGDYFLTSILLKPFFKKTSNTAKFKIDFLIEQKKTFEFKQKKLEIGGDLCYTDVIRLNGKSYIVFLNGDAMGKSLQGAGGALILGSIFGAIIERNKSNSSLQTVSPERWLKNTFIELHRAFETFDGSMLVSVVIGLIEEETNVMFFINAEHPFAILYRDGCAGFIENSLELRKLGTPAIEGKLFIKVFKLKPNDVILIGSDGKDDLVLNAGSADARIINFDETMFLRVVEESNGEIQTIKEKLSTHGELMDDLSILRIEYMGESPGLEKGNDKLTVSTRKEAIEVLGTMIDTNPLALKRLSKLYLQEKDFQNAYLRIVAYISQDSSDTEALYIACYSSMKLNRYAESLEFVERCLLREPANEKYLKMHERVKEKLGNVTKFANQH